MIGRTRTFSAQASTRDLERLVRHRAARDGAAAWIAEERDGPRYRKLYALRQRLDGDTALRVSLVDAFGYRCLTVSPHGEPVNAFAGFPVD